VSDGPTFHLVEAARLRIHEEIDPAHVARLVAEIRREGFVAEPIWVARDSHVVLNGHHRLAALRELGAVRVPAWVFDYESDDVELDRWNDGPPLRKPDVVARAASGQPFPPKTTKHTLRLTLPEHRTPLGALGVPEGPAHARSAPRGAGAPGA
jgi:L-serine kinase (ADP)